MRILDLEIVFYWLELCGIFRSIPGDFFVLFNLNNFFYIKLNNFLIFDKLRLGPLSCLDVTSKWVQDVKGGNIKMVENILKIDSPKHYIDSNPDVLNRIVSVVQDAFGKKLNFDDVYEHVTSPESLYLLKDSNKIVGIASYNTIELSGFPSLIVEGVAFSNEFQKKGLFEQITSHALNGESVICLRTQNPRMYRALEKICQNIFPKETKVVPNAIKEIRNELANYFGSECNKQGVQKGYYGGLFYGTKPEHNVVSRLFDRLGIQLNKGDALLCIGVR